MDGLSGCDCVADLEVACVGDTHYITRECLVDNAFLLRHEGGRCGEFHHLARADMAVRRVALEFAGAYLDEGYA